MADVEQGAGQEATQREARAAASRHQQEVQEEERKGILSRILRNVFEFFVRLLGIGKKREEDQQRKEQQDRQQDKREARIDREADESERERDLERERERSGAGRDGQAREDNADWMSDGAKVAGAAGLAAGAAGSAAAQRDLLDAAKNAGPASPESLLGMAQAAADGPASGDGPLPLDGLHKRAEAVFAVHEADIRSRVVPEASTDDSLVFDHTQPSNFDMDAVDQELAELLKCEGATPTHEELVGTFYGASLMMKLRDLQADQDAGLLGKNREAVMNSYLKEIEGQLGKLQQVEIPEGQRSNLRDKILEQIRGVYGEVAPKGHGTLDSRVLNITSRAESAGQRKRPEQDFSM